MTTILHAVEAQERLLNLLHSHPQGLDGWQVEAWAIREGVSLPTLAALVRASVQTNAARIDGRRIYPTLEA